ncbi:MAG: hypothetical protein KAG98_01295 [Lentisphaeria bacterium]|nr:hypothetical protein [Lentisphaeria bacterium]
MKKFHLTILLVLAALLTVSLFLKPWQTEDDSKQITAALQKADKRSATKVEQAKVIDFLEKDVDLSAKGVEDIYKHTLFLEDRELKKIQSGTEAAKVSASYDFELTGAGRLGKKEFAVIVAKPKSSRRNYKRRRSTKSTKKVAPVTKPKGQSHIYRVGKEIENSGYKLVSIHFGKRSSMLTENREGTYVTLRKGSETIRIYMDNNDKASLNRDKKAVEVKKPEEKKPKKEKEKALVIDENMPPPPPPPPISVGDLDLLLKGKTSKKVSPEKIKRLEKLRKNLLKQSKARKARAEFEKNKKAGLPITH